VMLGWIPQEDVFQRVQSAKDENTAARSAIIGGSMYFCFAFIPMFLAYSAMLIDPKMVAGFVEKDPQQILPALILSPIVPIFAQIMFFGALLSAIKSCASATLLAPSVSFSENILRPFFPHIGDKQFLSLLLLVLVSSTLLVTSFPITTQPPTYN